MGNDNALMIPSTISMPDNGTDQLLRAMGEILKYIQNTLDIIARNNIQYSRTAATSLDNCTETQDNSPLAETMTVEELAQTLKISKPTAYELVKQDGFPAFEVGRSIRINRRGLQTWMDRQSA